MSLSGNIYFGGQNLENSHPLESVQLDLDSIRHDISQNEIDIQENRNDIAQNVIDIQENINSISTLQNQCTDISYNLSNDTTTIANRLKLAAPLDWAVGNGVNVLPHLQIDNTSTDVTNQYSTYIYTGVEHQVNLSSAIGQVGDTVICNSKQNSSANSKGIVLTGKFPSEERGLRIDLNAGQSRYKGGQFFMDCSQGSLQSLIVKGGLFIQGTPAQGGTQIDVGAYIYTIIPALTTRMTTAETDINNLETRMTTTETDIDNLEGRMTTAETDIDNLEGRMTTAETDIDNLITDTSLLDYMNYDIPSSTLEFDSRLNVLNNYDLTNKSMLFLITNTANNANFGISAGVAAGDYSSNTRNNDILFLAKNDLLCTGLNIAKWETANSGLRVSFDSSPTQIYSSDLEVNNRLILNELTTHDTTLTSHTSTLASHTTNISTNSTNIATNNTNISTNTTNISTNSTNIATNTDDIVSLFDLAYNNAALIHTNTTNISTNTTNISTNTSDIALLQTQIAVVPKMAWIVLNSPSSSSTYVMVDQFGMKAYPGGSTYVSYGGTGKLDVLIDIANGNYPNTGVYPTVIISGHATGGGEANRVMSGCCYSWGITGTPAYAYAVRFNLVQHDALGTLTNLGTNPDAWIKITIMW